MQLTASIIEQLARGAIGLITYVENGLNRLAQAFQPLTHLRELAPQLGEICRHIDLASAHAVHQHSDAPSGGIESLQIVVAQAVALHQTLSVHDLVVLALCVEGIQEFLHGHRRH